jgi:hypothetical protein
MVKMPEPVVLADREHQYAPPAWRMYDALTAEIDRWLRLRPREVWPRVVEASRPDRIVWSSLWPVSPEDRIEFTIRPDGGGAAVRFVWSSPAPPDERGIGLVRHHLNEALAGDLRWWVDSQSPP